MNDNEIVKVLVNAKKMIDRDYGTVKQNWDNMEKTGDHNGVLQKGSRRSKKDNTQRHYKCGCAKTYLSYPALYTHIKNKHNGSPPEGTILGAPSNDPGTKGDQSEINANSEVRLSKRDLDQDEQSQSAVEKSISNFDGKEGLENFDEAAVNPMVSKIEQLRRKYKSDEIVIDDFPLLDVLEARGRSEKEVGFVVTEETHKAHPLLSAMNKYLQSPKQPLKTVESVLAKFLVELSKIASPSFYGLCSVVIQALYDCLQLYGDHFMVKLEQQNKNLGKVLGETRENGSFCENESADYITIIFDFFIKIFLRNYLQTTDFEFNFVIRLLKALNAWLVKYNLSKVEVEFNSSV